MKSGRRREILLLGLLVLAAPDALAEEATGEYPLDDVPRTVSPTGKLTCPEVPLITYKGDRIRYTNPAKVHPAFAERLRLFEQVVADTAIEVYGREPTRIVQKGSYYCRRIRSIPSLISEHGLGNAIDVFGFQFGPLPRGEELPEGLPKPLRRGFKLSLLKHWEDDSTVGQHHQRFLRRLAENLVAADIFRVLLGPAYPGHKNHFHFDCANYRLISI